MEGTMTDRTEDKPSKLTLLEQALHDNKLSRGGLLNQLKALGIGFGTVLLLGSQPSSANVASETTVKLKSTNPALNSIINEAPSERIMGGTGDSAALQKVTFFRVFRRFFRRW
jgi:hypothetical protein